ncbi:bifunctional anthranilate synthase component I family protein/class IV aminotransferase [Massilia terrae]|uniref:Chorismate-binding protein n=1 Tax=Massilia terrae TaxID=1811224 RepID=A0ABT2D4Y4_9BURK|nr:chorismate-binding protein [Massilia terrae]MCS0661159.1 chorismate-binding protein [Massilia terrae]
MHNDEVFALLDDASPDAGASRSRLYSGHAATLTCSDAAGWPQLLADLEQGLARGLYAVPLLNYELGEALAGIGARGTNGPLAQVLLFRQCDKLNAAQVDAWLATRTPQGEPAGIAGIAPSVCEDEFTRAIAAIRDYIAAGDTYQVNYTFRLRFDAFGSLAALFARLRARQPVPYGALIGLPGGGAVMSLSPELFMRHADGKLVARPMKGTARASGDALKDAQLAAALSADPKNRAENLMIVDLLRNDLGRVADTGSVEVPALFEVQRFGDVLQMTSTVRARVRAGATLAQVLDALYPCGSITGAPKLRTMQIIRELESTPRGIYTGAIGWIDPPAGGHAIGDFCLSVPIRTLALEAERCGLRRGEMGVGAGIVFDSEAQSEYAECQLKARFLTGLPNEFELFETIRASYEDGPRHLDAHLDRIGASCAYFGFPFQRELARAAIVDACLALPGGLHRVRLAIGSDGQPRATSAALGPNPQEPVRLLLSEEATCSTDVFLAHKTSHRARYDAAWRAAEAKGAFDILFFNERGELTEGGRSNVFVRLGGRWYTPPLTCGLLPGVLRGVMLAAPAWRASEKVITRAMLDQAEDIIVCNSLRGPLRAVLDTP